MNYLNENIEIAVASRNQYVGTINIYVHSNVIDKGVFDVDVTYTGQKGLSGVPCYITTDENGYNIFELYWALDWYNKTFFYPRTYGIRSGYLNVVWSNTQVDALPTVSDTVVKITPTPMEWVGDAKLTKVYTEKRLIENSSKNLFKNVCVSSTYSGVTITHNSDGTITVNGTTTAEVWHTIGYFIGIEGYDYILSGTPSDGTWSTYMLQLGSYGITAEGITYTSTGTTLALNIRIMTGVTLDNVVFYPMIRYAEITDDTYEQYYPTNKQLNSSKVNNGDLSTFDFSTLSSTQVTQLKTMFGIS